MEKMRLLEALKEIMGANQAKAQANMKAHIKEVMGANLKRITAQIDASMKIKLRRNAGQDEHQPRENDGHAKCSS
jgi:hypothetical protein